MVLTSELMAVFVAVLHPAHYQHYCRRFCDRPCRPAEKLSVTYAYSLSPDEVDRLGRENRDVIEERLLLDRRIQTLRGALNAAQIVPLKTGSAVYVTFSLFGTSFDVAFRFAMEGFKYS